MSNEEDIFNEVTAAKIKLAGKLVQDPSEENKFYAFIQVTRNKKGAQRPSNYSLRLLSEAFEKKNVFLSFILVEHERADLQASVKTTLFRFFPEFVRNAFVATEGNGVSVWVEPKILLASVDEEAIISKTKDILQFLEIPLNSLKFTSSENVPTRTACLKVIRLKSPLTQEELQEALVERKFHIPNEEWLSKMLDKTRKAGLVLRRKEGQFVLTLSGLKALGSEKNRKSPDISRALDIAKRGA